MNREEAKSCICTIKMLQRLAYNIHGVMDIVDADNCEKIIKALEQQPCEDAINREFLLRDLLLKAQGEKDVSIKWLEEYINSLPSVTPQEPKTGHCKDCKWWKDSDGAFRRGIGAESQCPMNRIEVYEWNGYCFMFEPREQEG